ncbi:fasciculation and elongation protein zeta-2 isoform X2 [Lutzomyia longipalpis]|uniref:fasciculation and elongation protein zeta-2 isoform X2 n=1 Tax=Lutzomyia longipalpis TaxID=7200 RepID=UPI00248433BA|nr:fasciculation and elongation protein zeta-2 isoform X2 [Lutzomyia longipalpis]
MRDLTKMAELKFEAPLAQFETDEWGPLDYQSTNMANIRPRPTNRDLEMNLKENGNVPSSETICEEAPTVPAEPATVGLILKENDNFNEAFSGSLEDLVNTFDEKITKCFGNYEESVANLAPVQIRSQEDIMNECQMWWTITGNFGNILPIDWSKSFTRQMQIPTLNLSERSQEKSESEMNDLCSEDEAVANDLDMHALILNDMASEVEEPIKTAEEVIKEIVDIMDEVSSIEDEPPTDGGRLEKTKEIFGEIFYEDKLKTLTISQLNDLYMEMEVLFREYSETLIAELAARDELEFEKELKNSFISLLLAVQNRRRQYHTERKRDKNRHGEFTLRDEFSWQKFSPPSRIKCISFTSDPEPKYLTTVIPYHMDDGPPPNHILQILIKILKAINEDSPTVPTLLTDYILKVLCPT